MAAPDVVFGDQLNEGKTKIIFAARDKPGFVLIQSKDRITAGDGARAHNLEGKAQISTATTSDIFQLLNNAGVKTHFIRQQSEREFIARGCDMIPIEFVTRRIATGSFLKRNPGVPEGFRFCPPKLEFFFKDDANHDPQWSYEQIISAKMKFGGIEISATELDIICKTTVCVFEILERAWASIDCALIDMKIEFGVDIEKKEIILADIIDSDSWRLWPSGDRRLMKDKQVYRELAEVTPEALEIVKKNFAWIGEKVKLLVVQKPKGRVVVLMGSSSDKEFGKKIQKQCLVFGIACVLRVTSAHKGPDSTLKIVAEYEGDGIPTVFVAVAGRSNGLGPVVSGSATCPVINCPPLSGEWGPHDLWSSVRLPSGLGCSTVLSPEAAALQAAQIFAVGDHVVWSKLRAFQLNTWIGLRRDDSACCN